MQGTDPSKVAWSVLQ